MRAKDNNGCFGQRAYTLTIDPPCETITVAPATLANGFIGTAYSQSLTGSSGTASYTFSLNDGALPGGLNLSAAGALPGTPTAQGTFNFSVTVTVANGCMGIKAYTVIISGNGLVFYPLPRPVRILDTRANQGNCDNVSTPVTGGTSITSPARRADAGSCDRCLGFLLPVTRNNKTVVLQKG